MPLTLTITLTYLAIGWVFTTAYYFFKPEEKGTLEDAIKGAVGWPLYALIVIGPPLVRSISAVIDRGRAKSPVFAFFFFNCLDPRFWATTMRNIINRSTK